MNIEEGATEAAEIQMKRCPRCKTIIRQSYRYGNVLKRTLKDMVTVKKRLLNARSHSKQFGDGLRLKIEQALQSTETLEYRLNHNISQLISEGLTRIQDAISPKEKHMKQIYPRIDDDTRYVLQVQVDVIEAILAMLQNAIKVEPNTSNTQASPALVGSISKIFISMKQSFLEDISDRTARVITLLLDHERFTTREHQAYLDEVGRLDLLRAFYIVKSSPMYDSLPRTELNQQLNQLEDMLLKNVEPTVRSQKMKIKELLEIIAAKLNAALGINDTKRMEIVKTIGMKQRHWYKCPNGHIYVTPECREGMQKGICDECDATIEGEIHSLRVDDGLASVMNGTRYAAWGGIANNMENRFDELSDFEAELPPSSNQSRKTRSSVAHIRGRKTRTNVPRRRWRR